MKKLLIAIMLMSISVTVAASPLFVFRCREDYYKPERGKIRQMLEIFWDADNPINDNGWHSYSNTADGKLWLIYGALQSQFPTPVTTNKIADAEAISAHSPKVKFDIIDEFAWTNFLATNSLVPVE